MKIMNIKFIALSILAIAGLSSCSSDPSYDVTGNPNNLFYLKPSASMVTNPNTMAFEVTLTPVGNFGTVEAKFPVRCLRPSSGKATVRATVDNSLIDSYNTKYGTSYKQFPEGVLDISKMSVTMPKDSCLAEDSLTISVANEN